MNIETIIGIIAIIASILGYIPQVVKSWKTHKVDDISISMILMIIFSLLSWLIYGFLKTDMPLILTNIISLNILLLLFTAKIKFGNNEFKKKWMSKPNFSYFPKINKNSTQKEEEELEPLTKDRLKTLH
ncbi:MAG: SemiSWEET family transporter [archaeon]